ncbi:MAG: MFS transporter [Pseudomonadota bacterium]
MFNDRRYILVGSSFLVQGVMIGGLFAYGVIFTALEQEFGWSRTLLSGCISLSFLVMGLGAMGAGHLNDRFGPRALMITAGVSWGLGYALMAMLDAPWQLFVLYGLFIGLGLSTHDVVTLSVIARVFTRRRGMMSGVVKVGTACGQIVIPLMVALLLQAFDWRTAVLVLGVGGGLALAGAGYGLGTRVEPPTPDNTQAAAKPPLTGRTLAEASRTRAFWTLCIVQFMFLPTLVTIPVHLPVHAQDLGLSTSAAAGLLSIIGFVSIVGRLSVGNGADRLGGRTAAMVCLVILGGSLAFLAQATAPWQLYLFCCVYGIGHGGLFTVVSPTVAEYFGMRAHGALFGIVLFCGTLGASMGPLAAGRLFDETGSYAAAFWSLAVMAAIGLVLVYSLPKRGEFR